MLMLSGGSDVTLSGGVDEVNRWQKGNILSDSLSAKSWGGGVWQGWAELSQATEPCSVSSVLPQLLLGM